MKNTLIILGLVIIVAASGTVIVMSLPKNYSSTQSAPPVVTMTTVPFTTIAEGSQSAVTTRVDYLVTTQDQLNKLWSFLKKPPPVPTVDFNTQVVAAVFAGEVPTAGYSIAVAAVEDANERVVQVQLTEPDQSCVLAQSTSAPYQVIELPKTSLPFTHDDTLTTKSCSK